MNQTNAEPMNQSQLKMDALLGKYGTIQIEPKGYSMYPLFVPGRDYAVITAIKDHKCKRGDVLLYRRADDLLVLHRVWRVKLDGCYMVGDNQEEIEGPIVQEQILGILVQMIRKGKKITTKNILYRCYSGIWLFLRPIRPCIKKPVAAIKRFFRKIIKKSTKQ